MFPVNWGSTAATSSAVTATGAVVSTLPVLSCVSVVRPRRNVATYSFSPFSAKLTPRVACPTNTGNTPVAIGSRVPACPTFFVFKMPRSLAHTSMDVQSAALSIMTIPSAIYASVTLLTASNTAALTSAIVPSTVAPAAPR